MNKKQVFAVSGAVAVSLLMAVPAFADTTTSTTTPATGTHPSHFAGKGGMHKFAGVIGTVSAINSDTITVTSKTGTVYAVDATNATIQKGMGKSATTLAISNIAVNDTVAVQGTVTGDNVVATKILDGIPARTGTGIKQEATHQMLANAAFGTVSNVDGSTITLTRKTKTGTDSTVTVTTTSDTTYKKNGKADTASDLAVGQRIVAMGTKDSSGNIAAATSVNIMVREPHTASTTPQT